MKDEAVLSRQGSTVSTASIGSYAKHSSLLQLNIQFSEPQSSPMNSQLSREPSIKSNISQPGGVPSVEEFISDSSVPILSAAASQDPSNESLMHRTPSTTSYVVD